MARWLPGPDTPWRLNHLLGPNSTSRAGPRTTPTGTASFRSSLQHGIISRTARPTWIHARTWKRKKVVLCNWLNGDFRSVFLVAVCVKQWCNILGNWRKLIVEMCCVNVSKLVDNEIEIFVYSFLFRFISLMVLTDKSTRNKFSIYWNAIIWHLTCYNTYLRNKDVIIFTGLVVDMNKRTKWTRLITIHVLLHLTLISMI